VGGDDGVLYCVRQSDGKTIWNFRTSGVVRSSPAISGSTVYVGDMEGLFYAIDLQTGKEKWRYATYGHTLNSADFGYDRRGILSSPVIAGDKIIFGCRDGFVYAVKTDGTPAWKMDHHVSWAISTVAVKDSFVITGTSDGRFVQAINLYTGNQIWLAQGNTLFWSSPTIVGDNVYIGGFDGDEYCLDLKSGNRVGRFETGGSILSSAAASGRFLYFGSDDGFVYALAGHEDHRQSFAFPRFVFYEPGINVYFKNGADLRIKDYLVHAGYTPVNNDSLSALLDHPVQPGKVIVFATDYFPPAVLTGGPSSPLRHFLDHGGRIVLAGINPIVYKIDEKEHQPFDFNIPAADTVLGIRYGENDTRTLGGEFPCTASAKGKEYGLPDFWTSVLQVPRDQVDLVLGENENGMVSAFGKSYDHNGWLIQCWLDAASPAKLDALLKLGEWKFEKEK
jgi:hypothetical protein